MGVDIASIIHAEKKNLVDFGGKVIAIDAYNALYQFLSIIRQPDGTPLHDSKGRITSHFSGLLYRTVNLLESNIKPVYVFDGKPHPLKIKTVSARQEIRERAYAEWQKALAEGDIEKARTKAQQTSKLTSEMVDDAKKLLSLMGIPYVEAPSDGEGQASYMAQKGDVWAAASQDFDALLFGSPKLVRNLTITGRRKLPRQRAYVDVVPELVTLADTLKKLEISREALIDISILVGTDFNDGIHGIGPKKALKYIKEEGSLEAVMKKYNFWIPDYEEVRKIFLRSETTDRYKLIWKQPDETSIKKILCDEYEFSEGRVSSALTKLSAYAERSLQRSLDTFFTK
jgi:flap endonuclease-1